MSTVTGYCSWCFNLTKHRLVTQNYLTRNIYECSLCKNETLSCRYCSNMAKGQPNKNLLKELKLSNLDSLFQHWDNELCAEHDGSIASFPRLSMKIADISDYKRLFIRDKYNLAKVGKYTGLGVAGVVSVAGIAASGGIGAAPLAAAMGKLGILGAASTGTAISSLSGAALTSASLAAVGGSVAAGTAIISATGLGLGGVMGGVLANKYYGEDKSFNIKKIKKNNSHNRTIFINGFTQENETDYHDWTRSQLAYDSSHTMYGVNWSSQTNMKLGIALGKGFSSKAAQEMFLAIAKGSDKKVLGKLNPLTSMSLITDLIGNPWHCSMMRAAQAGIQLAEAISRTQGQKFNLVGHSLGCRVIYYALEALSTKKNRYINDVILLGGAVGRRDKEGWTKALNSIDGTIYNCHSSQDQVLNKIYRIANAGLSSPIGIKPIELENKKIKNISCDDLVEGHMTWKSHYEEILLRIYN